MSTCREMKLDPYLSLCTNTISKGIKDLNMKAETLKLYKENMGSALHDVGV